MTHKTTKLFSFDAIWCSHCRMFGLPASFTEVTWMNGEKVRLCRSCYATGTYKEHYECSECSRFDCFSKNTYFLQFKNHDLSHLQPDENYKLCSPCFDAALLKYTGLEEYLNELKLICLGVLRDSLPEIENNELRTVVVPKITKKQAVNAVREAIVEYTDTGKQTDGRTYVF